MKAERWSKNRDRGDRRSKCISLSHLLTTTSTMSTPCAVRPSRPRIQELTRLFLWCSWIIFVCDLYGREVPHTGASHHNAHLFEEVSTIAVWEDVRDSIISIIYESNVFVRAWNVLFYTCVRLGTWFPWLERISSDFRCLLTSSIWGTQRSAPTTIFIFEIQS